ncbi:MAG: insulinase family protein [Planctomycetaceae bacterium]|jgi:predicted Zn-dependent peptidase|nr:insulinase family protein [Planctomycetaceae bacterium]
MQFYQFRQTTLSNGLKVIAEINDNAYSASVGFFVKTGSRNESDSILGASHFLEHIIFKGSESLSAIDVNRRLDELGADGNAYTNNEQTVFHISLLPEFVEDAVMLFGDILRPAFRENDFETEKQVILEEIQMYNDQPPFGADNTIRKIFFGNHPLGNNILGTKETVTNLTISQLRNYHNTHYTPDNIILLGTGRIDFDVFCECARKVCGQWQPIHSSTQSTFCPNNIAKHHRVHGTSGFYRLQKESASQQYTMIFSDSPCGMDAANTAASLLTDIIGDASGSRLYWELVDNGIADTACMSTYEYSDNGFFGTVLVNEPDELQKVLRTTKKIFEQVMKNGITQDELERAKNKALSATIMDNERPEGRLFTIGDELAISGIYRTLKQEIELIKNITINDIHNVLKIYPLNKNLTLTIGPNP